MDVCGYGGGCVRDGRSPKSDEPTGWDGLSSKQQGLATACVVGGASDKQDNRVAVVERKEVMDSDE